jgi:hypothetical protein
VDFKRQLHLHYAYNQQLSICSTTSRLANGRVILTIVQPQDRWDITSAPPSVLYSWQRVAYFMMPTPTQHNALQRRWIMRPSCCNLQAKTTIRRVPYTLGDPTRLKHITTDSQTICRPQLMFTAHTTQADMRRMRTPRFCTAT